MAASQPARPAAAPGGGMTPAAFARDFIFRWEDGKSTDPNRTHSLDPDDNGNWSGGKKGIGTLIGSNHGVTPAALAASRGVPVDQITRPVMRALTIAEAADIALALYYRAPRLNLLPWNRVTASILDMAWGAGPEQAIKLMQRMVGVADDGKCGPVTAKAVAGFVERLGEAPAARAWQAARDRFYDDIIERRPTNAKYRNGWKARSAYYTLGHPERWWTRFAA